MASRLELSPELVLVSPDLAEIARAALPDRPWEAFLPERTDPRRLRIPAAERQADDPVAAAMRPLITSLPLRVEIPAPLADPPHRPTRPSPVPAPPVSPPVVWVPPAQPAGRTWRAIALTMLAFSALAALSSLPVPDGPTFAAERPSDSVLAPTPQRPSGSAVSGSSKVVRAHPSGSRASDTSPQPDAIQESDDGTAATPPPPPPPATGRGGVVPGGGYVFGDDGRLVIAADGSAITRLEGATACGTSVTFGRIDLTSTGSFAAQRTITRAGKPVIVRVTGHVVAPGLIRGNLSVDAPGCEDRIRRYAARLS